jgi:hypothetical protein
MATDKEPFQSLTGMAEQLAEHSMEKAQGAMKNYFAWLQSAMSAAPWGNSDLNTKLWTIRQKILPLLLSLYRNWSELGIGKT